MIGKLIAILSMLLDLVTTAVKRLMVATFLLLLLSIAFTTSIALLLYSLLQR